MGIRVGFKLRKKLSLCMNVLRQGIAKILDKPHQYHLESVCINILLLIMKRPEKADSHLIWQLINQLRRLLVRWWSLVVRAVGPPLVPVEPLFFCVTLDVFEVSSICVGLRAHISWPFWTISRDNIGNNFLQSWHLASLVQVCNPFFEERFLDFEFLHLI